MANKGRTVMKSHAIRGAAHYASTELHVLRTLAGKPTEAKAVATNTGTTRATSTGRATGTTAVDAPARRAPKK